MKLQNCADCPCVWSWNDKNGESEKAIKDWQIHLGIGNVRTHAHQKQDTCYLAQNSTED